MKSGGRLLLIGLALMILGECKDMVSEDFLLENGRQQLAIKMKKL